MKSKKTNPSSLADLSIGLTFTRALKHPPGAKVVVGVNVVVVVSLGHKVLQANVPTPLMSVTK